MGVYHNNPYKFFKLFFSMIKWFERHNKITWSITILGAIIIFYMSSLTFEPGPLTTPNINSILYHILAFFFFGLFLLISLIKGKIKYLIFILGIIISIAYAISDEIHQFFVLGRSCSLSDVFLDIVGISFACMIYLILKYKEI
jgi:VanZ family protein